MAIKKGDNVILIAGKDRGKQGKVVRTYPQLEKAVIEGVNIHKKHRRPRKTGEKGQVVEQAHPVHFSNIQLFCESCKKGVRIGSKLEKGKKLRICASCKKTI